MVLADVAVGLVIVVLRLEFVEFVVSVVGLLAVAV